jgi:hypothetical protein
MFVRRFRQVSLFLAKLSRQAPVFPCMSGTKCNVKDPRIDAFGTAVLSITGAPTSKLHKPVGVGGPLPAGSGIGATMRGVVRRILPGK